MVKTTTSSIDKTILKEIEAKKKILDSDSSSKWFSLLSRSHDKALDKSSLVHSFMIEYPDAVLNSYTCHPSRRNLKKNSESLREAYCWAISNIKPGELTEELIQELAGRIEPSKIPARYRNTFEQVRVGGATWTPPYSEKIPQEMGKFVSDVNSFFHDSDSIYSSVEASCYAHLQLVRIHPFNDGNGRTSRLLQNLILKNAGLPPVDSIPGERFDYYNKLDGAVNGYRFSREENSISPQEKDLYNYFAGKVSSSLTLLLEQKYPSL